MFKANTDRGTLLSVGVSSSADRPLTTQREYTKHGSKNRAVIREYERWFHRDHEHQNSRALSGRLADAYGSIKHCRRRPRLPLVSLTFVGSSLATAS